MSGAPSQPSRPTVYRGGGGRPLLLLHGIGMTWHAWEPVLSRLSATREVIAPTLPGHAGGPPAPPGPVTVSSLADAVESWLDEIDRPVVDVAGNSFGGWLALELARRGRARSVVALSPAGAWTATRDMHRLAISVRLGGSIAAHPLGRWSMGCALVRRAALGRVVRRPERIDPVRARRLVDDMAGCAVLGELIGSAVRTGPIVPLPEGGCPVTLAWAVNDRVIPWARYGRPMLGALPQARVVALADVGHVPMSDDPDLVADTVLNGTAEAVSPRRLPA
ncbi:alpha/beta fold hydrolase [Pseudonocardia sp. RS010]|uniref:alpha/beta fold hydrolase n=1 Tax=Pseudonocardia sp. RS010 TaxID=3385979 RepID=UPI00399FAA69